MDQIAIINLLREIVFKCAIVVGAFGLVGGIIFCQQKIKQVLYRSAK
ncbi:MAG: hypothetical protein JST48_04205 [Bacteroidetes bacterium]|nr:hypothetical protein [Bacteroidota bacterium]